MPKLFRHHPHQLDDLRSDPLGLQLDSFATLLEERRYCFEAAWRKLRLVADLSRWLSERHLELRRLNEERVNAFLEERKKVRNELHGDRSTLALLLQQLREKESIPAPRRQTILGSRGIIIRDYERFLLNERGLATETVRSSVRIARRFLSHRFPNGSCRLERVRIQDINQFILHDSSCRGCRSLQGRTGGLRSFLGFLFQQKRISLDLAATVPKIAGCHSPELPRYLEAAKVEKVLQSCDRRRAVGKRDYAVLMLLARLGVRAGEVVKLTLDDIDWDAGELRIRGKGHRIDRLPLVQDVGQALAEYLQKGRPLCSGRRVFIQSVAPYRPIGSSHTISALVQRALARAKLPPPHRGAHMLRHSLATRMLRGGASLVQIGQVLRHQHSDSTVIYAKVDLTALRALSQPWPGGGL